LGTSAAKRPRRIANATAVIWKTLIVAEGQLRRLEAAHRLAEVVDGASCEDGDLEKSESKEGAARTCLRTLWSIPRPFCMPAT